MDPPDVPAKEMVQHYGGVEGFSLFLKNVISTGCFWQFSLSVRDL